MRKYQQLLLIIVSTISICLFLVYRHEYLRLRYVLEVLNIFGTPPKKEDILAKPFHFTAWEPEPVWQRINDEFYALSAFQFNAGEIKIIAIGTKNAIPKKLTCYLWIDDNLKSVMGKFSYTVLSQGEKYDNYIFTCRQKKIKMKANAISFGNSPLIFIRNTEHYIRTPQLTVCVFPSKAGIKTSDLIDFMAHNQILGVDEFIFYNNIITPTVSSALMRVASETNASFTFFTWNVPDNNYELAQEIVTKDCLLRTSGLSKYVMILNTNEFIIPQYSSSLLTLLNTLENSKNMQTFTVNVINFCRMLMPLKNILLNTRYMPYTKGEQEVLTIFRNSEIYNKTETISSRAIESDTIVMHRYINCNLKQDTLSDSSAMTFAAHLNNAHLKILFETGGLL